MPTSRDHINPAILDGGSEPRWQRSSRCEHLNCAEVLVTDERVLLRNSSHAPDGPVMTLSRAEWRHFMHDLKAHF